MEQKTNDLRFYTYFKDFGIRFLRNEDGSTFRVVFPVAAGHFYVAKVGNDYSSMKSWNGDLEKTISTWRTRDEIDYDEPMLTQALAVFEDLLPFEFYNFAKIYFSRMDVFDIVALYAEMRESLVPTPIHTRFGMHTGSSTKSFRIDICLHMLQEMGIITLVGTDDVILTPGRKSEVIEFLFKPNFPGWKSFR